MVFLLKSNNYQKAVQQPKMVNENTEIVIYC